MAWTRATACRRVTRTPGDTETSLLRHLAPWAVRVDLDGAGRRPGRSQELMPQLRAGGVRGGVGQRRARRPDREQRRARPRAVRAAGGEPGGRADRRSTCASNGRLTSPGDRSTKSVGAASMRRPTTGPRRAGHRRRPRHRRGRRTPAARPRLRTCTRSTRASARPAGRRTPGHRDGPRRRRRRWRPRPGACRWWPTCATSGQVHARRPTRSRPARVARRRGGRRRP